MLLESSVVDASFLLGWTGGAGVGEGGCLSSDVHHYYISAGIMRRLFKQTSTYQLSPGRKRVRIPSTLREIASLGFSGASKGRARGWGVDWEMKFIPKL